MMDYIVKFTDSNIKNIILNICIFLFGINFLYKCNYIVFGTFILLLIFKNFKIKFGNKFTLIVLILFSISWYIFGGHEIAGICLPICYLIGVNIDEKDERGETKFILLVSISLALYTTLFFINNAITNGIINYDVYNQPNIWTRRPLWATNIMLYSSLFNSLFGYIVFCEKDKKIKLIYFIIFIINAFYALMLGRRAALLMVGLSVFVSFIYKLLSDKTNRKSTIKIFIILFIISIVIVILLICAYFFNLLGFKDIVSATDLYTRFLNGREIRHLFNDMGRHSLRKEFLKYFCIYPWGGSMIHNQIGNYAHDLWLDTYDVAGVVSMTIMICYTFLFIVGMIRIIKNKNECKLVNIIVLSLLVCILVQLCIEPIMEACRAYMFGVCMIHGSFERIIK